MLLRSLRFARIRSWIAIYALCGALCALAGCAAAVTSIGPAAMGAGEFAGVKAADNATDSGMPGPRSEQSDRCNTLLQTPPGVEEVRKDKDGTVETRQWRLVDSGNGTKWAIAPEKAAPPDGWMPKPGIGKLKFSPPLADQLEPGGDPRFLAYAPSDTRTMADSDQMTTLTEVFGPAIGTFQWRGRRYGYAIVRELPCFKPLN